MIFIGIYLCCLHIVSYVVFFNLNFFKRKKIYQSLICLIDWKENCLCNCLSRFPELLHIVILAEFSRFQKLTEHIYVVQLRIQEAHILFITNNDGNKVSPPHLHLGSVTISGSWFKAFTEKTYNLHTSTIWLCLLFATFWV